MTQECMTSQQRWAVNERTVRTFQQMLVYLNKLRFRDMPNFEMLRKWLTQIKNESLVDFNKAYDWEVRRRGGCHDARRRALRVGACWRRPQASPRHAAHAHSSSRRRLQYAAHSSSRRRLQYMSALPNAIADEPMDKTLIDPAQIGAPPPRRVRR